MAADRTQIITHHGFLKRLGPKSPINRFCCSFALWDIAKNLPEFQLHGKQIAEYNRMFCIFWKYLKAYPDVMVATSLGISESSRMANLLLYSLYNHHSIFPYYQCWLYFSLVSNQNEICLEFYQVNKSLDVKGGVLSFFSQGFNFYLSWVPNRSHHLLLKSSTDDLLVFLMEGLLHN